MYNRYIRNDRGTYARIPEEERHAVSGQREDVPRKGVPPEQLPAPKRVDRADTGDLLLLGLLFLLLREGGDEEALIALALLFIL